jgi:hypothetical protein
VLLGTVAVLKPALFARLGGGGRVFPVTALGGGVAIFRAEREMEACKGGARESDEYKEARAYVHGRVSAPVLENIVTKKE